MLSDAREHASDQRFDPDAYVVGPVTGISITHELSGDRARTCMSRVRPGIHYPGWLFKSIQLDPRAHALLMAGGLGPFAYDPRHWPAPALKNPYLLLSCRAHAYGCSNPTLPVVALAPPLAGDLKK